MILATEVRQKIETGPNNTALSQADNQSKRNNVTN